MSRRAFGWLGLALVVAGLVLMLVGAAMFAGRAYPWLPAGIRGHRAPAAAPGLGWPIQGPFGGPGGGAPGA